MLRWWIALLSGFAWIAVCGPVAAGAFMLPEGQGQFIAGVGYSAGSRTFDRTGTAVPSGRFSKLDASGYLEYGLRPWLSLVLAPTLVRAGGVASNAVTGSDSSALGARVEIYGTAKAVVAVQTLIQPPTGNSDRASVIRDGGARSLAVDTRLMLGYSFAPFGLPSFIDIEPGARLRADPLPTEARLDLAFGVRPVPRLLILIQDFSALAPSIGSLVARQGYSKIQGSIVYDLSPRWALQVGAFRTIAGRNAIRETGPLAALWYRF